MSENRKINNRFNDVTGRQFTFDDLNTYLDFISTEASFWEAKRDSLDSKQNVHQYFNSSSPFRSLLNSIEQWTDISDWDDNTLQQQLNHIQSNFLRNIGSQWLWSGHDYVPRFIEIQNEFSQEAAESFFNYVGKQQVTNNGTIRDFEGTLLGYEYTFQNSDLVKRRRSERASIKTLRDRLQSANDELIAEVSKTKEEFNEWFDDTKKTCDDWEIEKKQYTDRLLNVNKRLAEKKGKRLDQALGAKLETWQQRIEELEDTYKEKLRLEKPAEYWKQASIKFKNQGSFFTFLLFTCVALGVYGLIDFFKIWLLNGEQPINLSSIQGVILFGSIAAVYAFVLRVVSRLIFSSFHLMRDAEEREQLTYLYLSLTEGSEVDKESRDIVLQALFSRSETGLLNQENGPSMPTASEIARTFTRTK